MNENAVKKSWEDVEGHYLSALIDPWYQDLVNIQDALSNATYLFFAERGLKTLHLPITTHSISSPMGRGSDSKPVKINLFGIETYLADSMQFMLEFGCRLNKEGCYYLMPSFRGDDADETHLCQFYHSEAEILGSISDVINLVEEYLRFMTAHILNVCGDIIRKRSRNLSGVEYLVNSTTSFPRVTVDEAKESFKGDPNLIRTFDDGFSSLTRQGEQALIAQFGGFVWLTEPDHLSVPFYHAFTSADNLKARAGDLLFGLGEVVGCGERHTTAAQVYTAMAMHGIDSRSYDWYCKMREDFPLRTAGFGLGTERYICWLLGHDDVRDCQILPRFNGVCTIP